MVGASSIRREGSDSVWHDHAGAVTLVCTIADQHLVWMYPMVQSFHASSRMQKWESQAGSSSCMRPGACFHSLQHRLEGPQQQGNDYLVSLADYTPTSLHDWRVLRLLGTGPQQDGVHR